MTLLTASSRSSVDRAPTMCSGGHRFDSCQGLRFFLCPTLVSCWSIYISQKRAFLSFRALITTRGDFVWIVINICLICINLDLKTDKSNFNFSVWLIRILANSSRMPRSLLGLNHQCSVLSCVLGGTVTSWLKCSTLTWALVWALGREIVLCSLERHFTLTKSTSPPTGING